MQWRNKRGGGRGGAGGRVHLETSDREISADLSGKREARKKGKMEQKRRKIEKEKGKAENENGINKKYKMRRGTFFFLLFFFSLFKTTEICFGSTKMRIFYLEKAFHAGGKKSGKINLPPQKKYSCNPPDQM